MDPGPKVITLERSGISSLLEDRFEFGRKNKDNDGARAVICLPRNIENSTISTSSPDY